MTISRGLIFALCFPLWATSNSHFEQALREVQASLNSDRAMEIMKRVYATDRYFTFPRFEQTAAYLKSEMQNMKLARC